MATLLKAALLVVVALVTVLQARTAIAAGRIIVDDPATLTKTRSLLEVLKTAKERGRPLHILFVHGIRARGSGYSSGFAATLAKAIGGTATEPLRLDFPEPLPWPRTASMTGTPPDEGPPNGTIVDRTIIWPDQPSWNRSQPFIMRTRIHSPLGDVTIDEVNYWPLLFPLKCRFLLVPEHNLSGNDETDLKLCEKAGWIPPAMQNLLRSKPRSGGGAWLNAKGKQQIMNWGLSDAVIALGPMRRYLNDTIEKACALALADGPDDEYVIFAESLGSFVVLDAFGEGHRKVNELVTLTNNLYLLANQFALLELARIDGIPGDSQRGASLLGDAAAIPKEAHSPLAALAAWGAGGPRQLVDGKDAGGPKQIIAFSDPSDLLTYRVPLLKGVKVVNVYDRQGFDLLGLAADPAKAHTGHAGNPQVWNILLGRK